MYVSLIIAVRNALAQCGQVRILGIHHERGPEVLVRSLGVVADGSQGSLLLISVDFARLAGSLDGLDGDTAALG